MRMDKIKVRTGCDSRLEKWKRHKRTVLFMDKCWIFVGYFHFIPKINKFKCEFILF